LAETRVIEKALRIIKIKMVKSKKKQILDQRRPVKTVVERAKDKKPPRRKKEYIKTGIPGFDALFKEGIPRGSAILLAGGAGSGKTIFCLQQCNYHASQGKKVLYMSFEEAEDKLREHMSDFGWDPEDLENKGSLLIKRFNPFRVMRNIDVMLKKIKGELLVKTEPIILPKNFTPDIVVVDSLTAIASAFTKKEESYRIYIEQLFRFFERLDTTSFLITETEEIPTVFSPTGVEEFLADGVIVFYNLVRGSIREWAIEVLKMRGSQHQKKIVALRILPGKGIEIYPQEEVYGPTEKHPR
jgi:circadian clock protein KaiC